MNFVKLPILEDLLTFGESDYRRHIEENRKHYLQENYPDTCSVMSGIITSLFKVFVLINAGLLVFTLTAGVWLLILAGFIFDGIIPFVGFTDDMVEMTGPEFMVVCHFGILACFVCISTWENYKNRFRKGHIKESIMASSIGGWIGNYCKKVEW